MDWNDLRHAVAVQRHGGLSGAARALRTSPQTVGRRVAALEAELGVALFVRHPGGYRVTPDGITLLAEAEHVEMAMAGLQAKAVGLGNDIAGLVRIAAPETIATHVLLPGLRPLLDINPELHVEIISGIALLGMARGEADIALRLVRPEEGALTVRRLGAMESALYADDPSLADPATMRLVGWPPGTDLPSARWLRQFTGRDPDIRLNHLAAHEAAVRARLGVAVLPNFLASGLSRVGATSPPAEPLWLVAPATDVPSRRIRAVYDELARIIGECGHF